MGALAHSVLCILCAYACLKALATANLSVYSIFMMLGGMLLPFSFGILFLDEPLTAGKIACVIFILLSLLLTLEKGGGSKGQCAVEYDGEKVRRSRGEVSAK